MRKDMMQDMKDFKLTWWERHCDTVKTVAGYIMLGMLVIVLCILIFSLTPYIGGGHV